MAHTVPADAVLPLQVLLQAAPDGIVVVDADGVVVATSEQADAMFGYEPGELIGHGIEELVPARHRGAHPGHRAHYAQDARKRPMGVGLSLHGVRKDSSEFPVDIALGTTSLAGRPVVLAAVRDMTERSELVAELRRARDQADAANRAKSEFLSRMSHELRTPLNAILGFAQLLELDDLTRDQRESAELIRRAGTHLLDLINEALDINRVESGKISLSLEPVALRLMIRESVELVAPLAHERGITIAHADLSTCTDIVEADAQRLKQVLVNLLSNAVKYNRTAGRVDVDWSSRDGRVSVRVRDTGPGIPHGMRHRVFTPFDRLGAEHTDTEGSGVGLALAQRLMIAMGGTLELDPPAVAGTSFSIGLPAATLYTPDVATPPAGQRDRPRSTVLYIEDNLSNLRLVERVVARRESWRLVHALHGALGLELTRSEQPAFILLDLHLPDLSGDQVLDILKADPKTKPIPVYIVTADATPGQRLRLLQAGAAGCVTKPIDVQRLLDMLDIHGADLADDDAAPPPPS